MNKHIPDEDAIIHVASSGDMTGSVPTPPHTKDEEEAYASLGAGAATAPRGDTRRKAGADRCGGGRS